jgi:hypothetical protein
LNIIFDNCSGQNKNNAVLKLPAWLMAIGYFKEIHFIFPVVGQTKNAADRLFNLLRVQRKFAEILMPINYHQWMACICTHIAKQLQGEVA